MKLKKKSAEKMKRKPNRSALISKRKRDRDVSPLRRNRKQKHSLLLKKKVKPLTRKKKLEHNVSLRSRPRRRQLKKS